MESLTLHFSKNIREKLMQFLSGFSEKDLKIDEFTQQYELSEYQKQELDKMEKMSDEELDFRTSENLHQRIKQKYGV